MCDVGCAMWDARWPMCASPEQAEDALFEKHDHVLSDRKV